MTLHAFGCSNTQGVALPDMNQNDGTRYSIHSWPMELGKRLDMPVKNWAKGGNGIQTVARNILCVDFDPQDTVVILWPHLSRQNLFFKMNGYMESYINAYDFKKYCGGNNTNNKMKFFDSWLFQWRKAILNKYYEPQITMLHCMLQQYAADYLSTKVKTAIHISSDPLSVSADALLGSRRETWNNTGVLSENCNKVYAEYFRQPSEEKVAWFKLQLDHGPHALFDVKLGYATDNSHPGLRAHEEFAKELQGKYFTPKII